MRPLGASGWSDPGARRLIALVEEKQAMGEPMY